MSRARRRLRLPAEVLSVRQGRHFARDALVEWGYERLADDVQLCVSELITNAVRHAGTELVLTLSVDTHLTVEVRDALPELGDPALHAADDPLASSGRGLHIVAAISTDWGVTRVPGGKAVWFTLRLPDAHSSDADIVEMDEHREAAGSSQRAREGRRGSGSGDLQDRQAGSGG